MQVAAEVLAEEKSAELYSRTQPLRSTQHTQHTQQLSLAFKDSAAGASLEPSHASAGTLGTAHRATHSVRGQGSHPSAEEATSPSHSGALSLLLR